MLRKIQIAQQCIKHLAAFAYTLLYRVVWKRYIERPRAHCSTCLNRAIDIYANVRNDLKFAESASHVVASDRDMQSISKVENTTIERDERREKLANDSKKKKKNRKRVAVSYTIEKPIITTVFFPADRLCYNICDTACDDLSSSSYALPNSGSVCVCVFRATVQCTECKQTNK